MKKLLPFKDLRVMGLRPLISPAILREELPISEKDVLSILRHREQVSEIVHGKGKRTLLVVGPCSVHDPVAAIEYAGRLKEAAARYADDIFIVMRVYFEKPRTTVGWKGLINDPYLDGSFRINEGLRTARKLLREIVQMGIPVGCEFLDPISPQYIDDLVSWGAIGARTTESQVHRELASGLPMPIGFKNSTNGSVKAAIEGTVSAKYPHHFLGVSEDGLAAIVSTSGNPDCHIVMRGSDSAPNYDANSVCAANSALAKQGLSPSVMIDVSHGNSSKDYRKQPVVAHAVADQIVAGVSQVFGVMIESFLVEGRQELKDKSSLVFGQSITDGCIGWDSTVNLFELFAHASRQQHGLKKAA